ncbi:hypothetical protein Lal_00036654 [Lupinus albus]|nr:hypothetical protein Lal_00036654 [Lupinus albus]
MCLGSPIKCNSVGFSLKRALSRPGKTTLAQARIVQQSKPNCTFFTFAKFTFFHKGVKRKGIYCASRVLVVAFGGKEGEPHRTNRQPAPTDEQEPTTELNQLESHAPYFSSAAMPTNQMIMDELLSLRGYITTRMDAFDTQSQKIHYELHRLSSRLSNMDVDKDSSEPES